MDHSVGSGQPRSLDEVRARRLNARSHAFATRRPFGAVVPAEQVAAGVTEEKYRTPEWLDHSFVLPLETTADGEPDDVVAHGFPVQSAPRHETLLRIPLGPDPALPTAGPAVGATLGPVAEAESPADPVPAFVRPPSPSIDFAEVVRRADATRRARRTAALALAVALLTGLAWVITSSALVLPLVGLSALAGILAATWQRGLRRAPIPVVPA